MTDTYPNVFLVGAPKCGTTALAKFISEHPNGFLPYPKEPSFWSSDLQSGSGVADIKTIDDYRMIYQKAKGEQVRLDASTAYLYSDVAVRDILAFQPNAKFMILLRNPVVMAQAYHMEKVFNAVEDEPDFEKAWCLQDARRSGLAIPINCPEPRDLLYQDVAALGAQLQRAMSIIPDNQLLVLFHDDMVSNPRTLWIKVQKFLGLPDDGRVEFAHVGSAHFNRFPALARFYQQPPRGLRSLVQTLKQALRSGPGAALGSGVKRVLLRKGNRASVSPRFMKELYGVLAPEISTIENLTGRDLKAWRQTNE